MVSITNVNRGGNKQCVSVCHDHTDDNETNTQEGEGEGHLHFANALVCQMVLSACNEFVFHHTFDGGIYIQTKIRQDVRCALFPDHLEEQRVNYRELFVVVTTFTCTSYNDNV
jgi:hypothetical protein